MPIIHLGSFADRDRPNFKVYLHTQEFRTWDRSLTVDENGQDIPYEERPVIYGPHYYCTYESHIGLCLFDRENNGYHDSDWYMTVWNDEKDAPESIFFATTRGWTYPCYASRPDATPEVREKYNLYLKKRAEDARKAQRSAKAQEILNLRKKTLEISKEYDISYQKLLRFSKKLGRNKFEVILNLFGSRIRSKFKISIRNQIVAWMKDPAPKYDTPLSYKQMGMIFNG